MVPSGPRGIEALTVRTWRVSQEEPSGRERGTHLDWRVRGGDFVGAEGMISCSR